MDWLTQNVPFLPNGTWIELFWVIMGAGIIPASILLGMRILQNIAIANNHINGSDHVVSRDNVVGSALVVVRFLLMLISAILFLSTERGTPLSVLGMTLFVLMGAVMNIEIFRSLRSAIRLLDGYREEEPE